MAEQIQCEDFEKVDIRVGEIVEVRDFPKARKPLYRLRVDFGPRFGEMHSAAGPVPDSRGAGRGGGG